MLTIDEAMSLYPTLPRGARARMSMRVFRDDEALVALARAACEVAEVHVTPEGALAEGAATSPDVCAEAFSRAQREQGKKASKRLADSLETALGDTERHFAMVRAMYALGFALDARGELHEVER